MSGAALLAGGRAWRLPPGAAPVEPPRIRPLPGAPATLPALALLDGQAVPVLAPGGAPGPVWLACQGPSGRLLVTGEALLDTTPDGALPLPLALEAPAGTAPSAPPLPPGPLPPLSGRARHPARAAAAFLALGLGEGRLVVPLAALRRIVAFPELVPAPGRPRGALGLGLAEGLAGGRAERRAGEGAAGVPVLVLDPLWLDPTLPPWPAPPLMAVLAVEGRLYALPCDRAAPQAGPPAGAELEALLAGPAAAALRALAPPLRERPPPPPEPRLPLLLARAGALLFALPAEEVAAVVPPQRPSPLPQAGAFGVVSHRGDVLPVLDAGLALGAGAVLAADAAPPLLRLAGSAPLALAVSAVPGLRHLPSAGLAELPGDGPVAALLPYQGRTLPLCRAAALARSALLSPSLAAPA